jgi:2-methylcitrate dehydratase PrpD
VTDYAAVVLAGIDDEAAAIVRRTVEALGGNPQATIWGTTQRTSVTLAALANGTAAHALDLDDVNATMVAHPSAQLLPALCALGEHEGSSGRAVLVAYIVGFEVGAALGRAIHPDHIAQGWFPVGTLGPLMQAAACARLLGLSAEQTQVALGVAANVASGLRCQSGTMAKPLAAGQGASSGLLAALLARDGFRANPHTLEARFGWFENFTRRDPTELGTAVAQLGETLEIVESGIAFKMYPCCGLAYTTIDAALEIARRHPVAADEVASIEVVVHPMAQVLLIHPRPHTVAEAKFSLEYCAARALLDREMGLKQFTQDKVLDPAVQALLERVHPVHENLPMRQDGVRQFPVELRVLLRDGTTLRSRVEHARGGPQNPVSSADLEAKFSACAATRLPPARIAQALEVLQRVEQLDLIAALPAVLRGSDGASSTAAGPGPRVP